MECLFCGYVNNERLNVYGTICPKCGEFVNSNKQPDFIKDIAKKNSLYKKQVLEYLRRKIEGEKDANRKR